MFSYRQMHELQFFSPIKRCADVAANQLVRVRALGNPRDERISQCTVHASQMRCADAARVIYAMTSHCNIDLIVGEASNQLPCAT